MSFPAASISFPGISTIRGGEFTLSRGIYPSTATIWMVPQATLNLPPSPLTFLFGGTAISFQDCAIDAAFVRKWHDGSHWIWSAQIHDRRWRWQYGQISGRFNVRLRDGTIQTSTRKSAAELAGLCLLALGEVGFDVSRMPTNVYPYVNWLGENPARALQAICDSVACDVVLGTFDNRVTIWPLGVGSNVPEGDKQRHPFFNYRSRRVPGTITVVGGPDVYESKFLLERIGREADGDQWRIDDLSYAPDEWTAESPWSFPSVDEDEDRAAAFDTVHRWWRVKQLAQGGMVPQGCTIPVTKLSQMLPMSDMLLAVADDVDLELRSQRAFLDGNFWGYGDTPENTTEQRYTGAFKLIGDWGVVETAKPVLYLNSEYQFDEPSLNLTCSFNVKNLNGEFTRFTRAGASTGVGALILERPELFRSFRTTYDGASVTGLVTNQATLFAEADATIARFQQKFADQWAYEMEYESLIPIALDGRIAQVKWSCGVNRQALTHVGVNEEFDVHNLSDKQRRAYASAG